MTLSFWEWHLIQRWPLRSIFARLLQQLLKDLVSWSPGKCSMIDHFLGDTFGVLFCQFWSIVLQSGAQLPIHTLNYWTEQSVVPSFSLGVYLSVTFLIVDQWQSCVCFIRSGVTPCTLLIVLYLYVPVRVTLGALVAHRYTYAPPHYRTLQYSRTFIPFSVSLWNDLDNPVFYGVGLAGFKSSANASLLA